jgi:hypothetical protein
VTAVIVANSAVMLWGLIDHSHEELLAGPRELVHGERESFIGGYRWQRSGLG